MRTFLGHKRNVLGAALLLAVVLPTITWAEGIDQFKLTKAIPADVFLAVHARDHAGKEFLNKQFDRLWAAVEAAHFDRDIKRLFKGLEKQQLAPGEELQGFDERWQQIQDLMSAVDWSTLGKREFAMGAKLGFPMPEFVILLMPPEDKVASNFDGLCGIVKTLADENPDTLKYVEEEDDGTLIRKLAFVGAPLPIGFTLIRHDDVLIVGFGTTLVEQSLALLRENTGEALVASPRFQNAFKKLPAPNDGLVFFDIAKLFNQLRGVLDQGFAMAAAGAPAEGEPGYDDFVKWKALPGKILDACDMFEYSAEVATTDGMRTDAAGIVLLRDDAKSHAFYPVLFNNKPLADPLKYVPANAKEFLVTSGIDLHALYKAVVKIIREDVPDGESMLAQLDALKDTENGPGIDIENDYISWIGGGVSMFSVPGPTPYSPAEFVFMLSVRDEDKGQAMLGQLFGMLDQMLAQQNGSIVDSQIEGAEGFKSVIHPMIGTLMSKPTLGIKDGWLFFGSSPKIIKSALDVAAGNAPNFGSNERFTKEGISPEGAVTALSFKDLTSLGEDLGKVLTMIPLVRMAMPPELQSDPVLGSLFGMVGRAGRVVRKLDFFQSKASRTIIDGQMLVTKNVVTYREPPKPKTRKRASTESDQPEKKTNEQE